MSGKPKLTTQQSSVDRLCVELLSAVRVSEGEIAAVSSSGCTYDRLRRRIAEVGQDRSGRRSVYKRLKGFNATLLGAPRIVVLSSAAAILAALVIGLIALMSSPSPEPVQTQSSMEATLSSPPKQIDPMPGSEGANGAGLVARPTPQTSRKRVRTANPVSEVATDFFPLTFDDEASAQQTGHIVRMKVPRSALIAFGVPMNMERAGELITADVMIGDDGLARAIRFVQ